MRAIILSDFHRGSFKLVGDFYEETLLKMGIEVVHERMPETDFERQEIAARYAGSLFLHNTFGKSFAPFSEESNVAFVLHEWSLYPEEWVPYLDGFNEIWVTTHHLRDVLNRSGVQGRIEFAPPAVDHEAYPSKQDWAANEPFRFLFVGESHFRKGLHLLFAAWKLAFPNVGQAQLTVKTSENCPFESPREDITLIKENWSREDLLKLYPEHDCLVSASLAEGWGLPIAEAMRAGLPVAANLWGGHGSMIREGNCFPIPHEEVPQLYCSVPELYAPGQLCANSRPEDIASVLKEVVTAHAPQREALAREAQKHILDDYGFDAAEQRIMDGLARILS